MPSKRPSVYVDTNVLSILYYSGSQVGPLYQHLATLRWWTEERAAFQVFASRFTEI